MYKCFKCDQSFLDLKLIISHLKIVEGITEGVTVIRCIRGCGKHFKTFKTLKEHLKICKASHTQNVNVEYAKENENIDSTVSLENFEVRNPNHLYSFNYVTRYLLIIFELSYCFHEGEYV